MSFRVTIPCTRAQGEAVAEADALFADFQHAPVLVSDEPDPAKPEEWLIHAYFEQPPSARELDALTALGNGTPRIEELREADWVTMSQAGLQPIRAGRFYVHTPMYRNAPPGTVPFEIDAGLAFGTGQHGRLLHLIQAALWHGCATGAPCWSQPTVRDRSSLMEISKAMDT